MTTGQKFYEIKGLFASAHDTPEELQGAPDIIYYKFYELEMAIPIIIGFIRTDDATYHDPNSQGEEGLQPMVAQRLSRDEDTGEWEWVSTDPEVMLSTLQFGDPVDVQKFKDSVDLFLERRPQRRALPAAEHIEPEKPGSVNE